MFGKDKENPKRQQEQEQIKDSIENALLWVGVGFVIGYLFYDRVDTYQKAGY